MLKNYSLPKRLKTIHFPGQQIEIWINEKKIQKICDLNPNEKAFIKDFVRHLEELGWIVRIKLN